jgi:hypothetical protein
MRLKILKNHAVIFGKFHFPVNPETTVKLVNAFASLGFMPQVVAVADQVTGSITQKISLSTGEKHIQFDSDRIDFISAAPIDEESDFDFFINEVADYFSRIENGSLKLFRIAIVQDILLESLSSAQEQSLRTSLLPQSAAESIEWSARWVNPTVVEDEKYNICLEAMTGQGMMMIVKNRPMPVEGIKILHDISTTPENVSARFGIDNLTLELKKIAALIEKEKEFIQSKT